MTDPLVCCELTEAGARDVAGYEAGDRLLLPHQTAQWFTERGYATILDPEPEPGDAA